MGRRKGSKFTRHRRSIYYDGIDWVELTSSSGSVEWNNWYNYEAQAGTTETGGTSRWANARTTNGSMLVWIPRYEYKITSGEHTATTGVIEVNFISKSTTTPTDGYIIHPAFTNSGNGGLGELAGIWIGKFESSNDGSGNVKAVPGVNPWRGINVSTMFARSQEFAGNNSLSECDSHMMKNSEWGAVAYLAHSKYGRNGTEVTINNHTGYKTGYAGYTVSASYDNIERAAEDTSSTSGVFPYKNTYRGVLASTTGNIYGIYDMSGGVNEYVMGVYSKTVRYSGFSSLPESKYYDNYTGYSASYKGDAVYETSSNTVGSYSWNGDSNTFVDSTYTWFVRGGGCYSTTDAGLFCFTRNSGDYGDESFRVVCTRLP